MNQLVPIDSPRLPALVTASGERASTRFLEFFAASIRNPHACVDELGCPTARHAAYPRAPADLVPPSKSAAANNRQQRIAFESDTAVQPDLESGSLRQ